MRSYGISLLPGYLVTNHNKIYARMGGINTKFDYSTIIAAYTPGFQVSLGYLINFTDNFGLRMEYNYSKFKTIHAPATDEIAATTSKFSSSEIKIGLEWLLAL